MNLIDKSAELTPVIKYKGILYKRDDLFVPFEDIPLSGGKVRQAISLIHNNSSFIKDECNSTILTISSIKSPQGIIITRVAKEYGFESAVLVSGSAKENKVLKLIVEHGGKVLRGPRIGYNNVLRCYAHELARKIDFFLVDFGINLFNDREAIIDSIGKQVQNIPDNLDYLVVPVGSGVTFSGIISGLYKYNKRPKNIIAIQISGIDRYKSIIQMIGNIDTNYSFIIDKTYPYSKELKGQMVSETEELDYIYEAKAHEYFIKNLNLSGNVLFWVVGNRNFLSGG